MRFACAALLLCLLAASSRACPDLIDCRGTGNRAGVWKVAPSPQFPAAMIGATALGALWEGGDSRLGRTLWQALDASALTGIATLGMKETFQRKRPDETNSTGDWFAGQSHQSFPSGDASATAAVVTPLIAEYSSDHPWVWALAALPVYDAAARVQYRAHWPTDVIAGLAVGVGGGLVARLPKTPVFLSFMPHGVAVGLKTRF